MQALKWWVRNNRERIGAFIADLNFGMQRYLHAIRQLQ